MTAVADKTMIDLLRKRDGVLTYVRMNNGTIYRVLNIAWGYDMGDPYAHVTTNISPSLPETTVDFFFTKDVHSILDEKMETLMTASQ